MTDVAEDADVPGSVESETPVPATADAQTPAPAPADAATPAPATAGVPTPVRRTFPRWGVYSIVACAVALLFLTLVINRIASSGSATTTTATTVVHQVVGGTAVPPDATQLHAPLRDLLDLTSLDGQRAAGFSLTNAATGRTVTLASLRGRVVVLTFADADCKDICPVLAAELHRAAAELPKSAVPVSFVTVNTDPLATAPKDAAILHQPLLASLPGWMFLTGSVRSLDPVWKDYGISITADVATGAVSHNDLLYFVTAKGALAWSALPFADESDDGSYSLPEPEVDRFAAGIAHYTAELLG